MQEKLSSTNIIVFISGIIFCVFSTILINFIDPGIAAKFLILNVFCYLAAFILPKFMLFLYVSLISVFMILFKVYGEYKLLFYLPYVLELFVGSFIISKLDEVFVNNELVSTFFGTVFGRLIFFITGYVLYDLLFKTMEFQAFFNEFFFKQIYGIFISIILVPLISYAIKYNTMISSGSN